MKRTISICLLLSVIILTGCEKKRIYEKHNPIEKHLWYRLNNNHIVTFKVPVKDTVSNYNIIIAVKYSKSFSYKTLVVGMSIYTPDKEEKYSQHRIQLRGEDGSYKGKGLGDNWDVTLPAFKNFQFNKRGIYTFEIENKMDKYEIPGIMQIGLIIEKTQQENE